MDLSVSPRRQKAESVTLLSYANSHTKTVSPNNNNYVHRYASHCVTSNGSNCYAVAQAPPCVVKKSEKFLRTFRRRSKSASRVRENGPAESPSSNLCTEDSRSRNFGGSALTLNEEPLIEPEPKQKSVITYVANGERARNPDRCAKPEKVTLVGFATKSTCNLLNLSGDTSFDGEPRLTSSKSASGFSTLKTSREVKMERERLRQERLQKLTQETKEWFDRVRQESKESSLLTAHHKLFNATSAHLAEERARFFDEAREKFHSKMNNGGSEELFGQFVRENQERFSQLLQQQQQQQNAAFSRCHVTTSTVNRAPAEMRAPDSGETDLKESSNNSATLSTTTTAIPTTSSSSPLSAKTQFRHRALSRDAVRDVYDHPVRESNPAPSAAEVVASLLGERGYTTRIPLKQRIVANHLVSRSNNLNNNKTILKKDLIESNAARVHTIKVHRETDDILNSSSKLNSCCSSDEGTVNENEEESVDDEVEREVQVARDKSKDVVVVTEQKNSNAKEDSEKQQQQQQQQHHESLHRTHSGSSGLSSSSSSGFSSLGGDKARITNESPVQSKFRQLLEKKNSCEHHPSFANHFVGFGKFSNNNNNGNNINSSDVEKLIAFPSFGNFPSFAHRPLLVQLSDGPPCRVPPPTPTLPPKVEMEASVKKIGAKMNLNGKVTKAKSTTIVVTNGKDGTTYRHTEEVVVGYGDSETESDEEGSDEAEDDDYDLDSVSVVDERHTNLSTVTSQPNTLASGPGSSGSGCDADSGRGNSPSCSSPASSSSSTVVSSTECVNNVGCGSNVVFKNSSVVRNGNRKSVKPARPISAVPSELSDISYTTSDDAGIEDEVEESSSSSFPVLHETISELQSGSTTNSSIVELSTNWPRINEPHRIACELLSTEEQYVSVLSLIDQKFHFRVDQENRVSKMFPQETLVQMFANIKPIYQFHAEFILPQLRERMDKWDIDLKYQKIGDIMVKFSHFFKMYTEYVKNFENARTIINVQYAKNSKFAAIMDEIHALPECGNLTLQQHMLTPIQRIPRYEMLLKKYLSKLTEDSPDRADSEQALQLVSAAAAHANDAMKRTEKFKKVLEVQESLGGTVDLVSPTRELVREGKIVKISARSGDHQDRYLFLFSDLLLLCSARLMSNRVISRPTYRLRARFEVDNMQVLEGDNLVTANTFYIRDDHKSVELYTHTRAEKEDWLEYLFQTIKELYQKKSSLRIGREMLRPLESEIGRKQPRLLKMESIQKCMDCGTPFTMMRKKHNCRACGIVVCHKCSGQKFPLQFEETKASRVCRACFQLLHMHAEKEALKTENPEKPENSSGNSEQSDPAIIGGRDSLDAPVRPKGLLEVSATASNVMSGFMTLRACQLGLTGSVMGGGAAPVKRWFALHDDFVLYTFASETDSHALTATPMPGYTVLSGPELKGEPGVAERDRERTIKMFYAPLMTSPQTSLGAMAAACRKAYFFVGSSPVEVKRWAEALKLATRAEVPSPNDVSCVEESTSLSSSSMSSKNES